MFITFEGVEGSGKSTQARKLANYFEGKGLPVIFTREPGGTPIAEAIRSILLNKEYNSMYYLTELLLYAASRAQHTMELIIPALDQGKVVICDRYYDSTTAYQGYARGLDQEIINQINGLATQQLVPHLTFVIDVPVEVGLERIKDKRGDLDRLELEQISFHQKVREGFLILAHANPDRIKVIKGVQEEAAVFAEILKYLEQKVG